MLQLLLLFRAVALRRCVWCVRLHGRSFLLLLK